MPEPSETPVKPTDKPSGGPGVGKGRAPGSRKGQFGHGQPGGPRPDQHRVDVIESSADVLAKMRKVFGQPQTMDRGPVEKRLRDWLKADQKGFLDRMVAMEKAGKVEAAGGGERVEADEKSAKVYELVDELLAEWERAKREEGV